MATVASSKKTQTKSKSKTKKASSKSANGLKHAMIAESAYYKAEQRNFIPGYEEIDWFEAEKEINESFQD